MSRNYNVLGRNPGSWVVAYGSLGMTIVIAALVRGGYNKTLVGHPIFGGRQALPIGYLDGGKR